MAFRAYFIRKKLYWDKKRPRPGFCPALALCGRVCVRKQCVPLYTQWKYPVTHAARIRTHRRRPVHGTRRRKGAFRAPARHLACASGTEDEDIVPGARPGLYVFLQHNGQTCTLHSIIQLDVGGDGILCGGAVDRAADSWIQPVLQMICCKGHPPSA